VIEGQSVKLERTTPVVPQRMVAPWRRCPTCGAVLTPATFPTTGPCYVCNRCNTAWAKSDLKKIWRRKGKGAAPPKSAASEQTGESGDPEQEGV
jgi:DNA-directed RNA polymerase subunit M/transcription elongation factor TFIIS